MPYQSKDVNVKFRLEWNPDSRLAFFPAAPVSGYHGSLESATRALRPELENALAEGLRMAENATAITVMGCADGTVLVVFYAGEGWSYDIAGPGRAFRSGVHTGQKRDHCEDAARSHAAQSYGGVVWETR